MSWTSARWRGNFASDRLQSALEQGAGEQAALPVPGSARVPLPSPHMEGGGPNSGMPHHQESSKPGWMGLWAPWSRWRCPCPWKVVGLDGLERSLPTQTSLWFHQKQSFTFFFIHFLIWIYISAWFYKQGRILFLKRRKKEEWGQRARAPYGSSFLQEPGLHRKFKWSEACKKTVGFFNLCKCLIAD